MRDNVVIFMGINTREQKDKKNREPMRKLEKTGKAQMRSEKIAVGSPQRMRKPHTAE